MFQRVVGAQPPGVRQQMLCLTSAFDDPVQAAEAMVQRLLSVSPDDWVNSFSPGLA